jgi:aquaporin Z
MNKYFAEFIGTFFLVLTIGCTVIGQGAGPLAPLAIGSALMVMIFAGGHISGGHFNPAVTLGVWLRGKCETKDVAPYMIFQMIGAELAALVVKFLKEGPLLLRSNRRLYPRFWRSFFSPLRSFTSC